MLVQGLGEVGHGHGLEGWGGGNGAGRDVVQEGKEVQKLNVICN